VKLWRHMQLRAPSQPPTFLRHIFRYEELLHISSSNKRNGQRLRRYGHHHSIKYGALIRSQCKHFHTLTISRRARSMLLRVKMRAGRERSDHHCHWMYRHRRCHISRHSTQTDLAPARSRAMADYRPHLCSLQLRPLRFSRKV
jgi:hypothetical protein